MVELYRPAHSRRTQNGTNPTYIAAGWTKSRAPKTKMLNTWELAVHATQALKLLEHNCSSQGRSPVSTKSDNIGIEFDVSIETHRCVLFLCSWGSVDFAVRLPNISYVGVNLV